MPPVSRDYSPPNVFLAGWYLRADLGERWGFLTSADTPSAFINPTTEKSGMATMGGLGAGFRYKWVRADFTVDYATKQKYEGTAVTSGDVTAKMQTSTGLFNAYADLGTWYRFTPYVGAGIGAARVTVSEFESAVVPPFTGAGSHSQWNLAWAAMGGAAFVISPNLQLDLGYRYLSFGNVESADGPGGHTTFRNLGAHEVRVGLRWNFDDVALQ